MFDASMITTRGTVRLFHNLLSLSRGPALRLFNQSSPPFLMLNLEC